MFTEIPVVYAVGNDYQILFYVAQDAYAHIRVGSRVFDDAVCGNLRSAIGMRRITVPQAALNRAGGYTLCLERIEARKCYNSKVIEKQTRFYPFYPVPESGVVRAFEIGDAHKNTASAAKAAEAFGAFDFLIVNGDISESICEESFALAHNLAAELTGGSRPTVFARGNHENRGAATELLGQYIPLRDETTFYSFRLGSVWGVVLDCGEDKNDDHPEYGGAAAFHAFRVRETDYLRALQASGEFNAPGIKHRICVVHIDFPCAQEPLFDTEREIYQSWCELLEQMGVELILCAHTHRWQLFYPGDAGLRLKTFCPTLVGTLNCDGRIGGTGLLFDEQQIAVQHTSSDGEISAMQTL